MVASRPRPPSSSSRDALASFLDGAVTRRTDPRDLFTWLARHSWLPSAKMNEGLLDEVVTSCAAKGAAADPLIIAMARLDADYAQGGTEFEFVPICGVMAIAARAAKDDGAYRKLLPVLHDAAEDLRFKVRDAVPQALARIGEARGERVARDLASWMDGYFHGAAVLRALVVPRWLSRFTRADEPAARLAEALALAEAAPRSVSRYPGHKALMDAMVAAPSTLATRFGTPVYDVLETWARSKDPVLRDVLRRAMGPGGLEARHGDDALRVKTALEGAEPARRDPRTDVGPTRGRGRKAEGKGRGRRGR